MLSRRDAEPEQEVNCNIKQHTAVKIQNLSLKGGERRQSRSEFIAMSNIACSSFLLLLAIDDFAVELVGLHLHIRGCLLDGNT